MWEDRKEKNKKLRMIQEWNASLLHSQEVEEKAEERAKQKKFHTDSIQEIIKSNLKYQINKKLSQGMKLESIIGELYSKNSETYREILSVVIQRTESIVKLKDLDAKRRKMNGEDVRLINPKGESLEKRIINWFNRIVVTMYSKYTARRNERKESDVLTSYLESR